MAISLPVYINCDRQDAGDPGGSGADKPDTPLGLKAGGSNVTAGLLIGVRATCAADAGTVTVKFYSDVSKTDEIFNVALDLSASPFKSSNILSTPIPFFETPFFQVNNSTDPNNSIYLTFYVRAIATDYVVKS